MEGMARLGAVPDCGFAPRWDRRGAAWEHDNRKSRRDPSALQLHLRAQMFIGAEYRPTVSGIHDCAVIARSPRLS